MVGYYSIMASWQRASMWITPKALANGENVPLTPAVGVSTKKVDSTVPLEVVMPETSNIIHSADCSCDGPESEKLVGVMARRIGTSTIATIAQRLKEFWRRSAKGF